jgi:hypothetical protein
MTAEEQNRPQPDPLPKYRERENGTPPSLEYHSPSVSPYDRPVDPSLLTRSRQFRRTMFAFIWPAALLAIAAFLFLVREVIKDHEFYRVK